MNLHVDTRWCSKCAICRDASRGRMRFGPDGYPLAGQVDDVEAEQLREAVRRCPIGALSLA